MKRNITRVLLAMLCMVSIPAMAAFKDVKVDLNSLLVDSLKVQGKEVSCGIAVAEDGAVSRVAIDDSTAVATVSGKYHSEHGWNNVQMVIAVDGPVKVGFGNCTYSNQASVITPAEGEAINVVMTQSCYKNNSSDISYGYYAGGATTLTLKGSNYCPYISVEAIAAEDIPSEINLTYTLGSEATGVVPSVAKVKIDGTFTIPTNTTLYVEGKTLVGWTDGTNEYKVGQEVTVGDVDITLTPVFEANTVSLADRTEPVTIKWNFGEKNGCLGVGFQGNTGFVVAQAAIGEKVIDVKLDIDATSGKFNNKRGDTWAQVNVGTIFTLPSCAGAEVTINAYGALAAEGKTATTIDDKSDYTSGKSVTYTIANTAETIQIVAGNDASYMSDIQVVLPIVSSEDPNAVDSFASDAEVVKTEYFNILGAAVTEGYKGMVLKVEYLSNGSKRTTKTTLR